MIPTSLKDNIIYQMATITKDVQDQLQLRFKRAGHKVTPEQFHLLTHLWYQDGLFQQDLAEAVGKDKTTISRVLNNMIRNDLVKRETDSDDLRYRRIYLTDYGRKLQDKLVNISGELYFQALQKLKDEDVRHMLKLIDTMRDNLK